MEDLKLPQDMSKILSREDISKLPQSIYNEENRKFAYSIAKNGNPHECMKYLIYNSDFCFDILKGLIDGMELGPHKCKRRHKMFDSVERLCRKQEQKDIGGLFDYTPLYDDKNILKEINPFVGITNTIIIISSLQTNNAELIRAYIRTDNTNTWWYFLPLVARLNNTDILEHCVNTVVKANPTDKEYIRQTLHILLYEAVRVGSNEIRDHIIDMKIVVTIKGYVQKMRYYIMNGGLLAAAAINDINNFVLFLNEGADGMAEAIAMACVRSSFIILNYVFNMEAKLVSLLSEEQWNHILYMAVHGRDQSIVYMIVEKARLFLKKDPAFENIYENWKQFPKKWRSTEVGNALRILIAVKKATLGYTDIIIKPYEDSVYLTNPLTMEVINNTRSSWKVNEDPASP